MEKKTRVILSFRNDESLSTRLQRIARMLLNYSGKIELIWLWSRKGTVDGTNATNDDIEKAEKLIVVMNS
jgi:hypothetical protein